MPNEGLCVRLKAGGPCMTICAIDQPPVQVLCEWCEDGERRHRWWDLSELEAVPNG